MQESGRLKAEVGRGVIVEAWNGEAESKNNIHVITIATPQKSS
jgi:hypothetical protein